ncbi:diguanylate cyclase [Actinocrispum sp. NPDC049592]|uniref:diguanylate cyclase domain-containing protein n=1 Tax=Actinocrispum sp. NPDC049592 TaxID=3154835 RepID=UPI00343CCEF2
MPSEPFPAGAPRRRDRLVRKWANEVTSSTHVAMQPADFEAVLTELVDLLVDGLLAEPFDADFALECGAQLVEAGCTDPRALRSTMDVLGSGLLALPDLVGVPRVPQKVVQLLGTMSTGYAEALRESTFAHQETLSRTLRQALDDVRRDLRMITAQFELVVKATSNGVAICDRDGAFVYANNIFLNVLYYTAAELRELTLFDVMPDLRLTPDGVSVQKRQKLLGKDEEVTWASVTVSSTEEHLIAVVADRTELDLLQGQLNHQALHDMVTRLPNRQFFTTRLERALRHGAVTVYHLDLDAFSHVTHGLGRAAGDLVLTTAGQRLEAVVAQEKAMVARVGADEFAVLVENPSTDVSTTMARFQAALAEPGGHVTSACAGVVDRPQGMTAAEVLDATELALFRAKRSGTGQWSSYHPAQDVRDREAFRRTMSPPSQVLLTHTPVVRLHDRKTIGLDAVLNVPGMPARLLKLAAERAWQHPGLRIHIGLEAHATGEVLAALDETHLAPQRLWLGLPAAALSTETVQPLTDAGVRVEARDFTAEHLPQLADMPIDAVRIGHRPARNFLVTQAMRSLTAMVHMTEAEVIVEGVPDEQQALWWQEVGADAATGAFHRP